MMIYIFIIILLIIDYYLLSIIILSQHVGNGKAAGKSVTLAPPLFSVSFLSSVIGYCYILNCTCIAVHDGDSQSGRVCLSGFVTLPYGAVPIAAISVGAQKCRKCVFL